jgi:hypothetical protein
MNGAGVARVTWEVVNRGRGETALSMKMGAVFSPQNFGIFFARPSGVTAEETAL